ncbi:Trans-cinnamate 4-monooxygenase [Frankliniella fusca]|uniref:Trans-cinnamate 4-monooxygenase n=1 Tax=Frankliniella fusca TaxID=407009 RepID=A0AAE1H229_9NEOP|nr:Trans-cinnamate 4-monooxygenase [Frankliniella fusca]
MKVMTLFEPDLFISDSKDEKEGLLTQHLKWWLRIVSIGELPGTTNKLLAFCRESMFALVICVSVLVQLLADSAVSGDLFGVRIGLAVYASVFSILLFQLRRCNIQACLRLLVQVSSVLDVHAKPRAKAHLASTARRSATVIRYYVVYACLAEVASVLALCIPRPYWHKFLASGMHQMLGGSWEILASVVRWCLTLVQCVNGVFCVVADYTVVLLIFTTFLSMAAMFEAISEALEVSDKKEKYPHPHQFDSHPLKDSCNFVSPSKTGPCNRLWARLQSILTLASLQMDAALSDLLPHILIANVVVPLLSTVEMVLHGLESDVFAVGMAPLVLAVFVPLCLVGDAMGTARLHLTDKACAGPWLEETIEIRKLRLGMVQVSQGRGGCLGGIGIGKLDRETCANALKSWFSFLQVLMNLVE